MIARDKLAFMSGAVKNGGTHKTCEKFTQQKTCLI